MPAVLLIWGTCTCVGSHTCARVALQASDASGLLQASQVLPAQAPHQHQQPSVCCVMPCLAMRCDAMLCHAVYPACLSSIVALGHIALLAGSGKTHDTAPHTSMTAAHSCLSLGCRLQMLSMLTKAHAQIPTLPHPLLHQ